MVLRTFPLLLALIAGAIHPAVPCLRLEPPVPGPIVRGFAPAGRYGGHWGADLAAPIGTPVVPAWAGRVTFAGSVAGMPSVTVDHGGGLRTSYSYLASIDVATGQWVDRSTRLGTSGVDHELEVLHFSVRVDGVYQDPAAWLRCRRELSGGLRLMPMAAGAAYPSFGDLTKDGGSIQSDGSHRSGGTRRRRITSPLSLGGSSVLPALPRLAACPAEALCPHCEARR
jgi:hypothetical protein